MLPAQYIAKAILVSFVLGVNEQMHMVIVIVTPVMPNQSLPHLVAHSYL